MTTLQEPTIVEFLASWSKDRNIIRRSRIPPEKKVMAAVLCASGYTYRDASKMLGGISHVAVHDAYKAVAAALPPLERKSRTVTIEENRLHLNEAVQAVVWLGRDVDSGEILAIRCSLNGSPEDGKKFIESILQTCTGRPLLRVGRGPNFPHSLKSLDFYFKIDTKAANFRQRISAFFFGFSPEPRN